MISYYLGVYNLQAEIYYAELALHYLIKKDPSKLYFMDTLIELIFNKLNRKCSRILLLEN